MMQPIITKDDSLARGIETAGGALGQAMQTYANRQYETNRLKQGSTILGGILQKLPSNASYNQVVSAFNEAQQQGVPSELIKQQADLYMPYLKANANTGAMSEMAKSMGIGGFNNASESAGFRQFESPESNLQSNMQQNGMSQGLQPSQAQMNAPFYQEQQQTQQPQRSPIQTINTAKQFLSNPPKTESPKAPNLPSNEEIIATGIAYGDKGMKAADLLLKGRDIQQKRFESDRSYHAKGAEETEKKFSGLRESIPKKQIALQLARNAIATGEVGAFSLNNLAERLNLPELKTASGAQLLTAGKENLLGNVTRISSKGQNQWFEQRLNDMFPKIGQSKEANDTISAIIDGEIQLDDLRLKTYDDMRKQDIAKYGYPRNDLDQRVNQAIAKDEWRIASKTFYDTRSIYETEKGPKWVQDQVINKIKVPKGTFLTPSMMGLFAKEYDGDYKKAIENAEKLGYRILTNREASEWKILNE